MLASTLLLKASEKIISVCWVQTFLRLTSTPDDIYILMCHSFVWYSHGTSWIRLDYRKQNKVIADQLEQVSPALWIVSVLCFSFAFWTDVSFDWHCLNATTFTVSSSFVVCLSCLIQDQRGWNEVELMRMWFGAFGVRLAGRSLSLVPVITNDHWFDKMRRQWMAKKKCTERFWTTTFSPMYVVSLWMHLYITITFFIYYEVLMFCFLLCVVNLWLSWICDSDIITAVLMKIKRSFANGFWQKKTFVGKNENLKLQTHMGIPQRIEYL